METESENSNFSFPIGQNRAKQPNIESTTVLSDYCISIEPRWEVGQNGKGNFAISQTALH